MNKDIEDSLDWLMDETLEEKEENRPSLRKFGDPIPKSYLEAYRHHDLRKNYRKIEKDCSKHAKDRSKCLDAYTDAKSEVCSIEDFLRIAEAEGEYLATKLRKAKKELHRREQEYEDTLQKSPLMAEKLFTTAIAEKMPSLLENVTNEFAILSLESVIAKECHPKPRKLTKKKKKNKI